MKLKQLKHWLQSNPETEPHCFVVAHAGGAQYLIGVEKKQELNLLRDDKSNEVFHFNSVEQAGDKLRKLGIKRVTLRLLDPYDEFGPASFGCNEDMQIRL